MTRKHPITAGAGGFTLIEVLTVMCVIAVLVNLAFPLAVHFIKRADAVQVITDFEAIRNGVLTYHAEHGTYPESAEWGTVPDGLAHFLPADLQFSGKRVSYRWRLWTLPDGTPTDPDTKELMGLQFKTDDAALLKAVLEQWNGKVTQVEGDRATFLVL